MKETTENVSDGIIFGRQLVSTIRFADDNAVVASTHYTSIAGYSNDR